MTSDAGLLGGTFDPPHNGHVAARPRRERQLRASTSVLVLVVADPGHKRSSTRRPRRGSSSRGSRSPSDDVVLDEHARTVDLLRDAARATIPCS